MERMALYLTKTFSMYGFAFTCNGWKNLLAINEPVFQELCVEFFTSVSFEDATVDHSYRRALVFASVANLGSVASLNFHGVWRYMGNMRHIHQPSMFF